MTIHYFIGMRWTLYWIKKGFFKDTLVVFESPVEFFFWNFPPPWKVEDDKQEALPPFQPIINNSKSMSSKLWAQINITNHFSYKILERKVHYLIDNIMLNVLILLLSFYQEPVAISSVASSASGRSTRLISSRFTLGNTTKSM